MGAGHAHTDADLHLPDHAVRWLTGIVVALGVLTLVGVALLWPSGDGVRGVRDALTQSVDAPLTSEQVDGRLRALEAVPCPGFDIGGTGGGARTPTCGVLTVEVLEGPDAGLTITLEEYDLERTRFEVGETLVLSFRPESEVGFQYQVADRQRTPVLAWLTLLFVLAVLALGRLRGLTALVGLGLTIVVLVAFTLPALLEGSSPVAVALVTASAIAFLAIYLAHGLTVMSTVALLGTLASLVLTVVLATVFVDLARINLLFSEEAAFLRLGDASVDLRGLFLAGIIIGTLGALDDMTVTQASVVWELRAADPTLGVRSLWTAAIRVGRDHVASTVNTLVLAYAGASLPLLLLFSVLDQRLLEVANGELVAAEIVRTLVGSIGLVAAVPLTTWLAAVTVVKAAGPRSGSGATGPDGASAGASTTS